MRWIAWLLVAACSSGPSTPDHPRPPPPRDPPAATQTAPSERECDELITHAVALGIYEHAAQSAEPHTTEADHEAIRRSLHEDFMAGCRMLPRDAFGCAVAATTLTELSSCQSTQRIPSSSTSNSSVAPPGMTPPAPISP